MIVDNNGLADFGALHTRKRDGEARLIAFDLLAVDGMPRGSTRSDGLKH